jgi:hypothetical protein
MTALSEVRVHWQAVRDLPEGCQALIEPMRAAGLLGPQQLCGDVFAGRARPTRCRPCARSPPALAVQSAPIRPASTPLTASPARCGWIALPINWQRRTGRELVIVALGALWRAAIRKPQRRNWMPACARH